MSNFFDRMVSQIGGDSHLPVSLDDDGPAGLPAHETIRETESQTPTDIKRVTQELLKYGYLDEAQKRDLFRCAIAYELEVLASLEPLDLEMRLDPHRGVAFLVVSRSNNTHDDEVPWLHPLVRRQRLTLEQSLLIALLRQAFALHEQEMGIGQGQAKMAVDDLMPQFTAYFEDSGSDAKNESRLLALLDQLKPYGIVSEVDNKHEFAIRPLIAYLANPESLTALLQVFKKLCGDTLRAEETN